MYRPVKENIARPVFRDHGARLNIGQRDRTLARNAGANETALDIRDAEVADPRFDVNHRCVRHANGEIYAADVIAALIITNQIDDDRAGEILRDNYRGRSFEIRDDIYLGAVPADDRDRTRTIHQLQFDVLAGRI